MDKKTIKKQHYITMEKFLRDYVGIQSEKALDVLINLNHRELKEMCEILCTINLKCIPFEDVTTEDLKRGEVILVADKNHNPAPYTNPLSQTLEQVIEAQKEQYEREQKQDKQKQRDVLYNDKNHIQSYEDYVDSIDNIASDTQIPHSHIKVLSARRSINRKDGAS